MTETAPYSVPKEPGRWRAWTLAIAVHAALFTFLWFGVRWKNETPVAMEAEIWNPQPREAAPAPAPAPEKPADPPPVAVKPLPAIQPDIALRAEKNRQARQAREEEQRNAAQAKAEQLAKKKHDAEQLKKEALEKKRHQDLAEQAARDKTRAEDLTRLMAQAGTGEAAQSQGSRGSAEYLGRVAAKIKSNTAFAAGNLTGNPAVEYAIELFPDGSLRGPVKKLKSSGIATFDDAVLKAIEKSQPFPPDKSGSVPSGFILSHRPKD